MACADDSGFGAVSVGMTTPHRRTPHRTAESTAPHLIPGSTPSAATDHLPDADPIPPIDSAKDAFHSAAELRQRWRALMGPLGFSEPKLWFVFVERSGAILPPINTLPLPTTPNEHLVDILMKRLGQTLEVAIDLTVACLYSRPGSDGLTARDRGWADLILAGARRYDVPLHPLFRANDINVIDWAGTVTTSNQSEGTGPDGELGAAS